MRMEVSGWGEDRELYEIEEWEKVWEEFGEELEKEVIMGKEGKVGCWERNLGNRK